MGDCCLRLESDYGSDFNDYYEHPEHLVLVLKKHFPDLQSEIISSLKKNMKEFNKDKQLDEFLAKIDAVSK